MAKKIKATIFIILALWFIYLLAGTIIKNVFLKQVGKCTKGILINEQVYLRYHKNTLYYEFTYNNNTYKNNSLEEDLTKVGNSVCVVYLESFPSINRPVKYFDQGAIKCDCSK